MDQDQLTLMELSKKGYCCAQMPMLMELAAREEEDPGLVRALSAFCFGPPNGQGLCGAAAGSLALLGYYGSGAADSQLALWMEEFLDWFKAGFGTRGIHCHEILEGGPPDMAGCGRMVLECYHRTVEILAAAGAR